MSKALLKAWEKAKRAELGAQIAGLRARTAHEIRAKRRAEKEGKLCPGTMATKKKRTKKRAAKKQRPAPAPRRAKKRSAPKRSASKQRAPAKKKARRAARRGRR